MQRETPVWQIPGVVVQTRELLSKKDEQVWAYSIRVMAMGGIFDLTTREEKLFKSVGEGQHVLARGYFEQYNGGIKLMVESIEPAAGSKAA